MTAERRTLNQNGVKDSTNMWRTFNGQRFIHWTVEQFAGQAVAYREVGIRARRVGEEIFIHPDDAETAARIDAEAGQ